MKLPAAVLFDMDGTLVDTEPYWITAEYALVERFGGRWTDEHAQALIGSALLTSAEYLRAHGGVTLDAPVIVDLLLAEVEAAVRGAMPWRPGALELLAECRERGVPAALVTMSYTRLAQTLTDALPPGTFQTVVTGDAVRRGKPDPEAYALACQRLGVNPVETVAIEDSPTGAASAQAAGCPVVVVRHRAPIVDAPGRTVIDTLAGLRLHDLAELAAGIAVTTAAEIPADTPPENGVEVAADVRP